MFKNGVEIYVFSGTGNTRLVANKIVETFATKSVEASINNIEATKPSEINLQKVIGLGFPVAAHNTYPFVWEFMVNLPVTENNTPIFMFDTLAGMSGAIVGPLYDIVKSKGYNPIGACEIIMPSNYFIINLNEEKYAAIREKGLQVAEDYANDLLEDKAKWRPNSLLQKIMLITSLIIFKTPIKYLFKPRVDKEKCTGCGRCVEICPTRNITIESSVAVLGDKCEMCQRCCGFCPAGAFKWLLSCKPYKACAFEVLKK